MAGLFTYRKFQIRVLTPLHIGSGEALGPFEYYLDGNFRVHPIPENFAEMLQKHGLSEVYTKYCKSSNKNSSLTGFCRESQKATLIFKESKGVKATQELKPNLSVQMIARTGGVPFIPGSSLKGVIRTAWLLKNAPERVSELYFFDTKNEGVKLFFQNISVDDFLPDAKAPKPVVEIDNFIAKVRGGEVPDFREYIAPLESSCFYGRIGVCPPADIGALMKMLRDYGKECLKLDEERYEELPQQLLDEAKKAIVFKLGFGKGYFANSVGFKWRGKPEFKEIFKGKNGEPSSKRVVNGMPPGWVSIMEKGE